MKEMKKRKKLLYIALPVLWAVFLYTGGSSSMGTVLARTVTTVISTMTDVVTVTGSGMRYGFNSVAGTYGYWSYWGPLTAGTWRVATEIANSYEVEDIVEQVTPVSVPPCDFVWVTEQEATETQDEILVERCSTCGAIRGRQTGAGTAVHQFQNNVLDEIHLAPQNGTAVVETGIWTCFGQKVLDELAERGDVALEIHYRYEGVDYIMTIPAGADFTELEREDGYYGFRYLDQYFPGRVKNS